MRHSVGPVPDRSLKNVGPVPDRSRTNRLVVTTSWDDGHPLDLFLAERLATYGVKGTFYVPVRYESCPRLAIGQIRELRAMGMEIGSHTVTHPRMTQVSDETARCELCDSKDYLEQILGEDIPSFCFPEGKFAKRFEPILRSLGYQVARTTVGFQTSPGVNPFAMPVTLQLWPHSRQILARHALKEGNFSGLRTWMTRWGAEADPVRLCERVLNDLLQSGGVLHIWGHSWELDQARLWPVLEQCLRCIAHCREAEYLTNFEVALPNPPVLEPVYA